MIKLERVPKPDYLTDVKVLELSAIFTTNPDKSVWNHSTIKSQLLRSANNKCAFCECLVSEESKYMEVEHFRYKKKYKNLVVEWDNLLPSCKRCNVAKSDHDVELDPLINPYDDDPRDHLGFRLYEFRGLTTMGIDTIDCLDLNNADRLVYPRFQIGLQVSDSIKTAQERLEKWMISPSTQTRNRLISLVETILNECQPTAIYSATTATIVLTEKGFNNIVSVMKQNDIWPDHMESLLENAKQLTLTVV